MYNYFNDHISSDQVDELKRFIDLAKKQKLGYVSQAFWYPAEEEPRCVVEKYIQEDVKSKMPYGAYAGCEWWFRVTPPGEGNTLHYDKDERLLNKKGALRHPLVATVLYLDDTKVPTVLLPSGPDGEEVLIRAKKGRLLAFAGNILHGVWDNDTSEERYTIMYNVWGEEPLDLPRYPETETGFTAYAGENTRRVGMTFAGGPEKWQTNHVLLKNYLGK